MKGELKKTNINLETIFYFQLQTTDCYTPTAGRASSQTL